MAWVRAVLGTVLAICGVVHAETTSPSIMLAAANLPPPTDAVANPWPSPAQQVTVQLPGMSHHFDDPVDEDGQTFRNRKYNERNWGLGVQLERNLQGEWQGWVGKTAFGVMKDSLNEMGGYAGHTWQKRLVETGRYTLDAGGGAFLFYRTLAFDGPHVLVPAVLPVLSATKKDWSLGFNLVAVPRVKLADGTMPGVIYAQFTKGY
jgi:hypothetical protein